MKFKVNRKIEDRVFVTSVSFAGYGNDDISASDEKEQFESFGYPSIEIGGHMSSRADLNEEQVVFGDGPEEELTHILKSEIRVVRDDFLAELRINIDKLSIDSESTVLTNKLLKAEALCFLFERTIIDRLIEAIESQRLKQSEFSNGFPVDVVI